MRRRARPRRSRSAIAASRRSQRFPDTRWAADAASRSRAISGSLTAPRAWASRLPDSAWSTARSTASCCTGRSGLRMRSGSCSQDRTSRSMTASHGARRHAGDGGRARGRSGLGCGDRRERATLGRGFQADPRGHCRGYGRSRKREIARSSITRWQARIIARARALSLKSAARTSPDNRRGTCEWPGSVSMSAERSPISSSIRSPRGGIESAEDAVDAARPVRGHLQPASAKLGIEPAEHRRLRPRHDGGDQHGAGAQWREHGRRGDGRSSDVLWSAAATAW